MLAVVLLALASNKGGGGCLKLIKGMFFSILNKD